jgi:hypothetical protein
MHTKMEYENCITTCRPLLYHHHLLRALSLPVPPLRLLQAWQRPLLRPQGLMPQQLLLLPARHDEIQPTWPQQSRAVKTAAKETETCKKNSRRSSVSEDAGKRTASKMREGKGACVRRQRGQKKIQALTKAIPGARSSSDAITLSPTPLPRRSMSSASGTLSPCA